MSSFGEKSAKAKVGKKKERKKTDEMQSNIYDFGKGFFVSFYFTL